MSINRFIHTLVLFSLSFFGCTSTDSIKEYITTTVERLPYKASVTVDGELEAKVSRTVMVPWARMSRPPLVGFLAQEGGSSEQMQMRR